MAVSESPPRTLGARRSPGERALAWVYTGPPGRLWSPLADIAVLWTRWIVARLRARWGV